MTTAPFRSSLYAYYITGHHDTEKDVKVRRQLAMENPHIVTFFSAIHIELIVKYLMKQTLKLDDFFCVYEWGGGGVMHLHCILWNFESEHVEEFDLDRYEAKKSFSKRLVQKVANFFNLHVSEWNLGKNDDGSWKSLRTESDSLPHPASISKKEMDEILRTPQDEENLNEEDLAVREKRRSFLVELHEAVQQHNIHKPDPYGPPLPNQKCAKEKPKTNTPALSALSDPYKSNHYCNKGFPKELVLFGKERIEKDRYRVLFKLLAERNCQTINPYEIITQLCLKANMDFQAILTYDALLRYCTKYVTKDDNADIFRGFRDDGGRPNDPKNDVNRSEVPMNQAEVSKKVTQFFTNQCKYSMVSINELHFHLLKLKGYITSRVFKDVNLLSHLNKLVSPNEIQADSDGQPQLVRDDEISVYEKRTTFKVPETSRLLGFTDEKIVRLSLFDFLKAFFVRAETLCLRTKQPIITFKPYISPKEKNNPRFDQYMMMVLLGYKTYTNRKEINNLSGKELRDEFFKFKDGNQCPFFVRKAFDKANKKKEKKKSSDPSRCQDRNDNDTDSDSEDSDTAEHPQDPKEGLMGHEKGPARENVPPPIAKFSEAYQEYGHMAPQGLDYEGSDIAVYDEDNDVVEEIRILSDQQDLIFNGSTEKWSPLYPSLVGEAKDAEKKLLEKIGVQGSSSNFDPSQLDPTQKLFLNTVIDWIQQCIICKKHTKPFPPLFVKLLGVAGTGKSRTIKTLLQEFERIMEESDLRPEQKGKIVVAAPTGVAAFNIGCGAASIHKTFNIPVKGKFQDLTGEAQANLEQTFENVWLFLADEVSMIGCDQLAKINDRLIQARLDENYLISMAQGDAALQRPPFGGLGIIVCGDFGQLVPIMQHSLMDPYLLPFTDAPKEKDRFTNKGKKLFSLFKTCIMLTKQHRQSGGEYAKLCLSFRDGSFTPQDHLKLQTRNFDLLPLEEKLQLESKGTRLVTTNKQAGSYNAKRLISTAKRHGHKIFKLDAFETGNPSKAVEKSENFGGLKSTIHLTIGSRVMLTSNLWVEAGLINGAQGNVKDIVFHDTEDGNDPQPHYALVEMDDYKGLPIYKDQDKRNWVPIFPIARKHQFNQKIQREQLPLRLSSAMTGHKVQGLSLLDGVVVQYPTPQESRKDPMDTWGLNYCILTRAPDLNKIAFINLPDYKRHMKLYSKTKGKNFFQMFLNFDLQSCSQFKNFLSKVANTSLESLNSATEEVPLILPIDFHAIQASPSPQIRTDAQYSKDLQHEQQRTPQTKEKGRQTPRAKPSAEQPIPQTNTLAMTLPRFDNPSSMNNCWLNSVIQFVLHALRVKANAPAVMIAQLREIHLPYGTIFMQECQKFQQTGSFSVNSATEQRQMSLKKMILQVMGIPAPHELNRQQDAGQCLQAILGMCKDLTFLWHSLEESLKCTNCERVTSNVVPYSIAPVDIANFEVNSRTFNATQAIRSYFQTTEHGIERSCTHCHGNVCSKSVALLTPPNFIVIQLKRFTPFGRGYRKNNAEAVPFPSVPIDTAQGTFAYNVLAVIHHLGNTLSSGHYVAYLHKENNWFYCNDSRITPLDGDSNQPTRHGYLLLLKLATPT